MINNINSVKAQNLCAQCGICSAICPKHCISMVQEQFDYLPRISGDCIDCGLCKKVCPVNSLGEYDEKKSVIQNILGGFKEVLAVKTRDRSILLNSTSGGFVTTFVQALLRKGKYDCAFLVCDYNYDRQLCTQLIDKTSVFINTAKSRYLPVSHENAMDFIAQNPTKKVILVAVGCALQGILNFIKLKSLSRDNYLLLGLFCDKSMNYGVFKYFEEHPIGQNRKIAKLFFRDKRSGGWPGHVRIEYDNGEVVQLPNTSRMEVKDYFRLERCLYCLDKLNKNADISVGDNYIDIRKDKEGMNSIIIRSSLGQKLFSEFEELFEFQRDDVRKLVASQYLLNKKDNLSFWNIKNNNFSAVSNLQISSYNEALRKMQIARHEPLYDGIQRDIIQQKLNSEKLIKKIKFCGITVFKKKVKKNKQTYFILGVPIYVKKR